MMSSEAALQTKGWGLVRDAEFGQRRYTIIVDDHVAAILVTGYEHHGSDPSSLQELVAEVRQPFVGGATAELL
jgi:hypothetical protein